MTTATTEKEPTMKAFTVHNPEYPLDDVLWVYILAEEDRDGFYVSCTEWPDGRLEPRTGFEGRDRDAIMTAVRQALTPDTAALETD